MVFSCGNQDCFNTPKVSALEHSGTRAQRYSFGVCTALRWLGDVGYARPSLIPCLCCCSPAAVVVGVCTQDGAKYCNNECEVADAMANFNRMLAEKAATPKATAPKAATDARAPAKPKSAAKPTPSKSADTLQPAPSSGGLKRPHAKHASPPASTNTMASMHRVSTTTTTTNTTAKPPVDKATTPTASTPTATTSMASTPSSSPTKPAGSLKGHASPTQPLPGSSRKRALSAGGVVSLSSSDSEDETDDRVSTIMNLINGTAAKPTTATRAVPAPGSSVGGKGTSDTEAESESSGHGQGRRSSKGRLARQTQRYAHVPRSLIWLWLANRWWVVKGASFSFHSLCYLRSF